MTIVVRKAANKLKTTATSATTTAAAATTATATATATTTATIQNNKQLANETTKTGDGAAVGKEDIRSVEEWIQTFIYIYICTQH